MVDSVVEGPQAARPAANMGEVSASSGCSDFGDMADSGRSFPNFKQLLNCAVNRVEHEYHVLVCVRAKYKNPIDSVGIRSLIKFVAISCLEVTGDGGLEPHTFMK